MRLPALVLGFIVVTTAWAGVGIPDTSPNLWPGAIIPYEFDPALSARSRHLFEQAASDWMEQTPAIFLPRLGNEFAYLYVVPSPQMDSSCAVGYSGFKHTLLLSEGAGVSEIGHELGHAIGMGHEHQRWDRPDYLEFDPSAADPTLAKLWDRWVLQKLDPFDAYTVWVNYTDYDLHSIMHYSPFAYTSYDKPGMRLGPKAQNLSFRYGQISTGDASTVVAMYRKNILAQTLHRHFICGIYEGGVLRTHLDRIALLPFRKIPELVNGANICAWGHKVLRGKRGELSRFWVAGAAAQDSARRTAHAKNEWWPYLVELENGDFTYDGGARCPLTVGKGPIGRDSYRVRITREATSECQPFDETFSCHREPPASRLFLPGTFCFSEHVGATDRYLYLQNPARFTLRISNQAWHLRR